MRELGDRHGEARTLGNLGIAYRRQGRWEEAIEAYEAVRMAFQDLGDEHAEGLALVNLGVLYASRDQREEAHGVWREALEILRPDSPEAAQVKEWLKS